MLQGALRSVRASAHPRYHTERYAQVALRYPVKGSQGAKVDLSKPGHKTQRVQDRVTCQRIISFCGLLYGRGQYRRGSGPACLQHVGINPPANWRLINYIARHGRGDFGGLKMSVRSGGGSRWARIFACGLRGRFKRYRRFRIDQVPLGALGRNFPVLFVAPACAKAVPVLRGARGVAGQGESDPHPGHG